MFAFGILLFSTIQGYVGDLFGYLLGNVLGIPTADIVQLAVLGGIVLLVVAMLRKELLYATFDPLGAAASGLPVGGSSTCCFGLIGVTIVVSLQAVGIILVVAMLVTPAATGQLLVEPVLGPVPALACAIAIVSSVVGLYLSFWLDVASGRDRAGRDPAFRWRCCSAQVGPGPRRRRGRSAPAIATTEGT